ncbi:MAG: hypothetical protein JNK14_04890 [Chitinophagaceae bacterium]|nr:hypothetical protein [Chitinophagaceae bacterium]
MKKVSFPKAEIKFVLIFASIFIVMVSCKKEINLETDDSPTTMSSPPPSSSNDCNIDYTVDSIGYTLCHLTIAGKESVINFMDYRELVYYYIEQQFDQEYNVLIKTLIDPGHGNLPSSAELDNALAAFMGIYGDTLYPQIFIPNYDDLKEASLIGNDPPIIVPFCGQATLNEDDGYTGYFVNLQGELEEYPEQIDSAFASSHEIWVLSLNESVDNSGELDIIASNFDDEYPYYSRSISSISSFSPGNKTTATVNCRINNMTVKQHKESWIGGKSEIAIKGYLWTWSGRWNGNTSGPIVDYTSDNSTYENRGKLIKEFKRKDVKNEVEKTINYNLHRNWKKDNYYSDPICFGYVIFERDNWPTGLKTHYVNLPSAADQHAHYLTYRSKDDNYSVGTIYNMPLITINSVGGWQDVGQSNNFLADRAGIKFNAQEY